jgi:hypothetical protein
MTDFRALCAELLSEIQALRRAVADEVGCSSPEASVIARARAALAQPEPQGPTDEEIRDLWNWAAGQDQGPWPTQQHCFARAVLARWGRPAIEPVPVAPTNLDAEFRSWYGDRYGRSYFGGIALVECVEWTQFVLARYARPAIEPVPGVEGGELDGKNG